MKRILCFIMCATVIVALFSIPASAGKRVRDRYEAVAYELLRPAQLFAIRDKCPIVYVPFGALEWHSFQNPLGTDTLKSHAICCEAALKYGGVVLPGQFIGTYVWQGPTGMDSVMVEFADYNLIEKLAYSIAKELVNNKWKVIVFVTGHDVAMQRDMLQQGIEQATKGTGATGFAVMEGEMHDNPDPSKPMEQLTEQSWPLLQARIEKVDPNLPFMMDHAGTWETACMMYAYPDHVDMNELRKRNMCTTDMTLMTKGPEGILGNNPLKYATPALGKKIMMMMSDQIGQRAVKMLEK